MPGRIERVRPSYISAHPRLQRVNTKQLQIMREKGEAVYGLKANYNAMSAEKSMLDAGKILTVVSLFSMGAMIAGAALAGHTFLGGLAVSGVIALALATAGFGVATYKASQKIDEKKTDLPKVNTIFNESAHRALEEGIQPGLNGRRAADEDEVEYDPYDADRREQHEEAVELGW